MQGVLSGSNNAQLLNLDRIRTLKNQINDKLLKRVNKSLVFADLQFIEWFHLSIGIENLIKIGGALNIKEFSSFQRGEDHLKATFFLSQPLIGTTLETLREIIISSKFQFINIITNVDTSQYDKDDSYMDGIKDDILMWMGNANFTIEVFYDDFPFVCLPQSESNSTQSSSIVNFLNPLSSWTVNSINDLDYQIVDFNTYSHLVKQDAYESAHQASASSSQKEQVAQTYYQHLNTVQINEIKSLSVSINQMLSYLDAKDDCYSLGILGKIVSHELNTIQESKQRRKNASNKLSLLFIDRNLDLSMIASYHDETVFDKMNNLMPNLNQISSDVRIDLSEVLFDNKYKSLPYGCFFHSSDESCRHLVEQILLTKPKECLLEVYRKLNEIFPSVTSTQKESKASNRISRITVDTVKTQIKSQIRTNQKSLYENIDFIQILASYCIACDTQNTSEAKYDKMISYCKVLTQNIHDREGPSILSQLYQMFNDDFERSEIETRKYTLIDLFIVIVYVYSLIGKDCFYGIEEENRIKKLILNEFQSKSSQKIKKKFKFDAELIHDLIERNTINEQFIEGLFDKLKTIKTFYSHLKQFNKLVTDQDDKYPVTYRPLLKQISEYLVKTGPGSGNTEQLVDIEYRTTTSGATEGIKDLIKTFKLGSYLVNSNKTHPLSNEFLVIYVIGGITAYEMKIVKEIFSKTNHKVLIGSSHIHNHAKLIRYLAN